jgi:hypothetical protein
VLQGPQLQFVSRVKTIGTGRGFICLSPEPVGALSSLVTPVVQVLSERFKVVHVTISTSRLSASKEELLLLSELIKSEGVRHGPLIAFGDTTLIAQSLAVLAPKLARTLLLVDPVSRQTNSLFEGFLQKLERTLPLGLPLRQLSRSLTWEPFLHRIRCPALVVTQSSTSKRSVEAASLLAQRLPCCWHRELKRLNEAHQLLGLIENFQLVQARCPMKGGRPRSQKVATA